MRLVDEFPFYADLTQAVHDRQLRLEGVEPRPGETVVADSWHLLCALDDPTTGIAIRDFVDFLDRAMGVKLGSGPLGGPAIMVRLNPELGERGPETHCVMVGPSEVLVSAATPAGLFQAFVFIEDTMRTRRAPYLPQGIHLRSPLFQRRIHRSPFSTFITEETVGLSGPPFGAGTPDKPLTYTGWTHSDAGPDAFYHDNLLSRLAHHGMNGVWVRGGLCAYSRTDAFPEFGERADEILGGLRRLCERAARYGISVYLFFNEPLGFPVDSPLWERYPECRGSYVGYFDRNCLCTSIPRVRDFLHDGMRYVFEHAPELGGVILITASEYPTHCYCHVPTRPGALPKSEYVAKGILCPRCAEREPQEIVGEVVTLIRDGVRCASPTAEVMAWNWSWSAYEPDPQEGILRRLPEDVIVMGDFERGIMTEACGFAYQNDEYSLKIVGPSDRFRGLADFAHARGRRVYAKIQIGTTHENGSVPYLPVLQRIVRKFQALTASGVTGLMTCWNFGNMPSLATELAGLLAWDPQPEDPDEVLAQLASRHFGPEAAPRVVEAWNLLSEAIEDFPGSIPVQYHGPVSRGPAFPFVLERINQTFPRSWLLDCDVDGDDMSNWLSPFTAEHVLTCFHSLCGRWREGVRAMLDALPLAQGGDAEALAREAGAARVCGCQFRSAANVVDFLLTRDQWYEAEDAEAKETLRGRLVEILRDEERNCEEALPLVDADSRLGFHGEGYGYMFNRPLIEAKLSRLRDALAELERQGTQGRGPTGLGAADTG